jgi:DNA-binding beta-propeller fold protein YncE
MLPFVSTLAAAPELWSKRPMRVLSVLLLVSLAACGASSPSSATPASATPSPGLSTHSIALPGGPPVRMDFIALDAATGALWVPAGNTGRVDVIDVTTGAVTEIGGFATQEIDTPRGRRLVGPSSVAIGDGVAYVGNRGDNRVCAINSHTHVLGGCAQLESMPDAVLLLADRSELWVTTPRAHTIVVLHVEGVATPPTIVGTIAFDGEPECLARDVEQHTVFTNLEDLDRTVAIDESRREVTASWPSGCGQMGPRGVAFDATRRFAYVACTDHLAVLDVGHDGAALGTLATGGGVDDIAFVEARSEIYVGSGAAAVMRVVAVDDRGGLHEVAHATTSAGARNAVVDAAGTAYLTDSEAGRIIVVTRE